MISREVSAIDVFVDSLRQPYGHERSIKVSNNVILDQRFLVSFPKSVLGRNPWGLLHPLSKRLNIPDVYVDLIQAQLPDADMIHLGFEEPNTVKLYLEFADEFHRSAARSQPGTSLLVHKAFKWDSLDNSKRVVSHYRSEPSLPFEKIVDKLRTVYFAKKSQSSLRVWTELLQGAAMVVPSGSLFFMEVEEEGNPRLSFDLNLYDAKIKIGDIESILSSLLKSFNIAENQVKDLITRTKDEQLGHVSGGIGRDGKEFFSFYFGVEERQGRIPMMVEKGSL